MANAIQRYVANKACCIATNVQKTDNKIKYGAEDMICCINKDFIANTFAELLMCNPVATDATWYKARFVGKYLDTSPTSFPGTVTFNEEVSVVSTDGSLTTTAIFPSYPVSISSVLALNLEIFERFKTINTNTSEFYIVPISVDTGTGEMILDGYYTSKWGNSTNGPLLILNDIFLSPVFDVSFTSTITSVIPSTDSCITFAQQCDIKNWLDEYCQSC